MYPNNVGVFKSDVVQNFFCYRCSLCDHIQWGKGYIEGNDGNKPLGFYCLINSIVV